MFSCTSKNTQVLFIGLFHVCCMMIIKFAEKFCQFSRIFDIKHFLLKIMAKDKDIFQRKFENPFYAIFTIDKKNIY